MPTDKPAKIGKYDIIDVLGRGGMGVVYKATDPNLGRLVAIKMMTGGYASNPDLLKRFFREAQSTASLQHPNIVTIFELGDHGGNPYLVMEYLEGESLDAIINSRRPISMLEKMSMMIEVCRGLSYAHQRGIVHRDIKPANIMVQGGGVVKIVDFGIAHIGDKNVTSTGQIMGSLGYMSPEQVNGKPVDSRSDIFSTGVVLYQLCTHAMPFDGQTTAATLLKIVHDPPPPLKNFLTVYPPELETVVLRALAKDREERFQSADDFALDLGQLHAQLKQDIIGQHLQQATLLLEKADSYKAKDELLHVLRIDRQHTRATHLLREVQQKIQKEEISEQIRKLRLQAEDATAREDFDAALHHLDGALRLSKENSELLRLRESTLAAQQRAQKLQSVLRRAESAHQEGELDLAKQAVEEALQISPGDAQAKALYRVIQRDWVERSRQRQVENLLTAARREITSRRFTAAVEILKQAETIDPATPQIRTLMESAQAGREQERRRRDVEAATREIEEALNRDDYRAACVKAEQGLQTFPDERTLLKLKALAEKQRELAERKQFVEEQLATARRLMEENRSEELLVLLEAALVKVGNEPRLQSLQAIVREHVQRERTEKLKQEYLQEARVALQGQHYEDAIRILEKARVDLPEAGEIEDLLQLTKEEAAAEMRRKKVEAAADKAHALIAEEQYDQAVELLETTLQEGPDEELRIVLAEAKRAREEHEEKAAAILSAAEKLLQARKAGEAVKFLESQPASLTSRAEIRTMLVTSRNESERMRRIELALESARQELGKHDYAAARRVLEDASHADGSTPELDAQLAEVDGEWAAASDNAIEKTLGDVRMLVMAREFRASLARFGSIDESLGHASEAMKAQCESLRMQATEGLVRQQKMMIERYISAGEFSRASDLLRESLAEFPTHGELADLGSVLQQETHRHAEFQKCMAGAQKCFEKSDWKHGSELLRNAFATARSALIREQVLQSFAQQSESVAGRDWRAADELLRELSSLRPDYPQLARLRTRIADCKRDEAVSQCVEKANRLRSSGDLQASLAELKRGLSEYPDQAKLQAAQNEVQEAIRQQEERAAAERSQLQKEEFLQDARRRAQRESALGERIRIMEEALTRYPGEAGLQAELGNLRQLSERATAIASEADGLEQAKKYDEALQQWETLRSVYSKYPGLDANVERLRKLSAEARSAARETALQQLRAALESADYEGARAQLREAKQSLPGDRELPAIERKIEDGISRRAKAHKLFAEGEKAFGKQKWQKGGKAFVEACEIAALDPVVQEQAVAGLVRGAESALLIDLPASELLLSRAAELQPSSSLLGALRARIERQKRGRAGDYEQKADRGGRAEIAEAPLPAAAEEAQESATRLFMPAMAPPPAAEPSVTISASAPPPDVRPRTQKAGEPFLVRPNPLTSGATALNPARSPLQTAAGEAPSDATRSGTRLTSFGNISGWEEEILHMVEKQLVTFVGPLARIIVKKAAAKTTSLEELYSILGTSLERPADRETFLAGKGHVSGIRAQHHSGPQAVQTAAGTASTVNSEVNSAAIELAARRLARYLGPISALLAKRTAPRADSLRAFYLLLAEHVENTTERHQFLNDAGFPNL